ncbi:trypsin-like serine peptidase, partial [Brevundimonas denitrificans]|uniref:trypsin-like serine peptidase n=1 Tax=Brevundimonas denitrificans TaxID=1443434 RepID=UPI0024E0C416
SPVDITAFPWRTIGRVNRSGNFCTGILVAEDQVLTAAHCFWNKRTKRWSGATEFHFVAGYDKGRYAGHARGLRYRTAFAALPDLSVQPLPRDKDWAVLTLDKPLGKTFGFAEAARRRLSEDALATADLVQAGYSRDYSHILTVHEKCRITHTARLDKGQAPIYFHQCDATNGDSGSPIFVKDGAGYRLIGLHSATARLKTGEVSGLAIPSSLFYPYLK